MGYRKYGGQNKTQEIDTHPPAFAQVFMVGTCLWILHSCNTIGIYKMSLKEL